MAELEIAFTVNLAAGRWQIAILILRSLMLIHTSISRRITPLNHDPRLSTILILKYARGFKEGEYIFVNR